MTGSFQIKHPDFHLFTVEYKYVLLCFSKKPLNKFPSKGKEVFEKSLIFTQVGLGDKNGAKCFIESGCGLLQFKEMHPVVDLTKLKWKFN